jgi:hypothetical protein
MVLLSEFGSLHVANLDKIRLGATLQVTEQGKRSFNTYINDAPLALRGLLP